MRFPHGNKLSRFSAVSNLKIAPVVLNTKAFIDDVRIRLIERCDDGVEKNVALMNYRKNLSSDEQRLY